LECADNQGAAASPSRRNLGEDGSVAGRQRERPVCAEAALV
jgi:hypothetical protein